MIDHRRLTRALRVGVVLVWLLVASAWETPARADRIPASERPPQSTITHDLSSTEYLVDAESRRFTVYAIELSQGFLSWWEQQQDRLPHGPSSEDLHISMKFGNMLAAVVETGREPASPARLVMGAYVCAGHLPYQPCQWHASPLLHDAQTRKFYLVLVRVGAQADSVADTYVYEVDMHSPGKPFPPAFEPGRFEEWPEPAVPVSAAHGCVPPCGQVVVMNDGRQIKEVHGWKVTGAEFRLEGGRIEIWLKREDSETFKGLDKALDPDRLEDLKGKNDPKSRRDTDPDRLDHMRRLRAELLEKAGRECRHSVIHYDLTSREWSGFGGEYQDITPMPGWESARDEFERNEIQFRHRILKEARRLAANGTLEPRAESWLGWARRTEAEHKQRDPDPDRVARISAMARELETIIEGKK